LKRNSASSERKREREREGERKRGKERDEPIADFGITIGSKARIDMGSAVWWLTAAAAIVALARTAALEGPNICTRQET